MKGSTLPGLVRRRRRQHHRQSGYAKESRLAMDEFDVNTTSNDHSGEDHANNGSSRRNFLKAAVVGSAAAVAAGGVGAATLTLTGHHTGLKRIVGLDGLVSGVTSAACVTKSQVQVDDQDTFNQQDTIFFWFKVNNVPAGTYTFDILPKIGGSSTIIDYRNSSSASNVRVYEGPFTFECHPTTQGQNLPNSLKIASSTVLPITFTAAGGDNVLLEALLGGKQGNTGGAITLTATLYQGTDTTGTVEATGSANFTIK